VEKNLFIEWMHGSKGTPDWLFAGAAAGNRWTTDSNVEPTAITETAYDEAIKRAAGRQ
jgi:hypothetical protein